MKKIALIFTSVLSLSLMQGCMTYDPYTGDKKTSNSTKGATAGAITGAILGNQVKGSKKTRQKAQIAGALLGGLIGGGVGNYMDKQEAQLRRDLANTGVSVGRNGKKIILNMPGNITFNVGNASIQNDFHQVLDAVAKVLKNYKDTDIEISGHTDSTGSNQANQVLSEQRASSVGSYLRRQGIQRKRIDIVGFGESQPLTSNKTSTGRTKNRRVELTLTPQG
ncbi:MAG: hypothetical protein CMP10_05460 [Zetaproteobacteria bacterium]|nr:hypothetical protein [Pseudobdellovibrionaceae bacterium]